MKLFFSAVLAAAAVAKLEAYEPMASFAPINSSPASRYMMKGLYGANEMGYWGEYVFIYGEISGAPIPEEHIVVTWAAIQAETESGGAPANNPVETVECTVVFRSINPDYPIYNEIDVRTYAGSYNAGSDTLDVGSKTSDIWKKPAGTSDRHYQYVNTNTGLFGDPEYVNGCFVQRMPNDPASSVELKKGYTYNVKLGYDVYSPSYDQGSDNATAGDDHYLTHLWSAEGDWQEVCWWDFCSTDPEIIAT